VALSKDLDFKGQLISKCPFGVFKSTKKKTKSVREDPIKKMMNQKE
jgi:hypothetical protein